MSIKKEKEQAINNIICRTAIHGALQRNTIYQKATGDKIKKEFRNFLSVELSLIFEKTILNPDHNEDKHFKLISSFAEKATKNKKYTKFLHKERLTIGTSQKLINLFWKMNWLLKPGIKTPIHCPFDAIIISEFDNPVNKIKWTQLNSIEEYKELVDAAKKLKNKHSNIAEWELEKYGLTAYS